MAPLAGTPFIPLYPETDNLRLTPLSELWRASQVTLRRGDRCQVVLSGEMLVGFFYTSRSSVSTPDSCPARKLRRYAGFMLKE